MHKNERKQDRPMAVHIKDKETDRLVRRLAAHEKVGLTEAVKRAVAQRLSSCLLLQRVRAIQDDVAGYPKTGQKADKAFFDAISGD
jgi:antitoxin VapB